MQRRAIEDVDENVECSIRPELHHWSFDINNYTKVQPNTFAYKKCRVTKTEEKSRMDVKRWRRVPYGGKSTMPSGASRLVKTFPLVRSAYWTVSTTKTNAQYGGARCPIKCDEGYRLKHPAVNEYVCTGAIQEVEKKNKGNIYHNSFGHLLCELDTCNIPAGRNYNKIRSGDGYCKLDGNSVTAAEGCLVACATGYTLEDPARDKITCKNGKLMSALPKCVPDPSDANHPNYGFTKSVGSFQFRLNAGVANVSSLISTTTELVTSQIRAYLGCTSDNACTNGKPPTISSMLKRNSGVDTIHIFYEYWMKTAGRRLSGFTLAVPTDISAVAVMTQGPVISGSGSCRQSLDKFAAGAQLDLTQCETTLTNEDGATCRGSCPLGQEPVDITKPITVTCSLGTDLSVENAVCVSTRCFVGDFDTTNFSGFLDTCDYDSSTKTIKKTDTQICKAAGCRTNHTIYFNDGITCGSNRELTSKTMCVPTTTTTKCFLSSDTILKNADGSGCNIYAGVEIGSICKVSCIDGYSLKENATFELECGATGFISTPECVKTAVPEVDSSSVASLAFSAILLPFLASITISIDAL